MFGTRSSPRKQTPRLGFWSWISHWAGGNKDLNSGAKCGGETPCQAAASQHYIGGRGSTGCSAGSGTCENKE